MFLTRVGLLQERVHSRTAAQPHSSTAAQPHSSTAAQQQRQPKSQTSARLPCQLCQLASPMLQTDFQLHPRTLASLSVQDQGQLHIFFLSSHLPLSLSVYLKLSLSLLTLLLGTVNSKNDDRKRGENCCFPACQVHFVGESGSLAKTHGVSFPV